MSVWFVRKQLPVMCLNARGVREFSMQVVSKEQCNAIKDITSPNIVTVFFCTTCLRALPIALKQFDDHAHIVSNTESQINNHEKAILTSINRVNEETSHKILDFTAKVSSVSALNSQLKKKSTNCYSLLTKGIKC